MNEFVLQSVNFWLLTPISLFFRGILLALVFTFIRRFWVSRCKKGKVSVVVLGDIGRSPRMQYHSLSLASHGFFVYLIGFAGSVPHHTILDSKNIKLHFVRETRNFNAFSKIIGYILKVLLQTVHLFSTLIFKVGASEFILLQNPPCIPSLAVCWMISLWNGSKLIVDWHNYGYSILSLSLGKSHVLVKIARWYEELLGQLASGHLCVTKALENDLMQNWKISAKVMHDKPAKIFQPIDLQEKHKFFQKLATKYSQFESRSDAPGQSRFTKLEHGKVVLIEKRPALIVSSTSWTEDEDFSILLEALEVYDKEVERSESRMPHVICAITGKGPLKSYYQEVIASREWKHVNIITPWLEAEDYPKLLACADLGVSLHTSSSGLDLPMKVVDMFGCGLPVAAIDFACLDELVQHNINGIVFHDSEELAVQLTSIFKNFPNDQLFLRNLRDYVGKFREVSWDKSWNEVVLPMFRSDFIRQNTK